MKLLIYGLNFSPEMIGIGKYSGEMATWLAGRNHQVRAVTAPPYYPDWKVGAGYAFMTYRRECIDGADVWRCPLYVPARPSGLKRILHLASFAVSSLPVMLRQILWKPDVVLVIEPPLFCAPVAWLVARLSGGKCWLHVQDFEVDAAFALGILPFAWMRKLASAKESWLMRRFDAVSTISTSMRQRLQQKGVPESKAVLFPNWADLETVKYDEDGAVAFRHQHQIPEDSFVVLYAGNMGEKQGLEIIVDVARRFAADNDIVFVLCGAGAAKSRLQSEASGLANTRFLPLQLMKVLAAMLSSADLHLVIQKEGAADLVMPSKLTNILAVGGYSLITASEDTELGRLVRGHSYLGKLCAPEDADALAEAIMDIRSIRQNRYHADVRSYAEANLAKENVLTMFETNLLRIVGQR